jgi:hypothetical protein
MHCRISSLDRYIEIVKTLIYRGNFIYRGQSCSSWKLEPGIIRRIKKTYSGIGQSGLLFNLALNTTLDLLKSARSTKNFKQEECDLNTLAILQHYGAATPLLDFTYNPLVALYFACQPHQENGKESDAKIFSINYANQVRSRNSPIRSVSDPSEIEIKSALSPSKHPGIWQWKPPDRLCCEQSKTQDSVFVFGWDLYWEYPTNCLIKKLEKIIVSGNSKKTILKELKERYDISEQTLFPDVSGFAQSHSHDKVIEVFSAEDFYEKGEEEYRDGSFEWAAEYYKMAYTKKSDWTDARYKHALSLNGYGDQFEALDVIEKAIREFGVKWNFLVCKAVINEVLEKDWKADFEKAKEIADKENEGYDFEQFVKKYGPLSKL